MEPHRRFSRRFPAAIAAALLGIAGTALAGEQQDTADDPSKAASQSELDAMRSDIDSLKQGQEAIQKTLEEIKTLLRQAPPAQPQGAAAAAVPDVTIELDGMPIQGAPEARLTVVEFSDYQCPYCARHTRDTYPKLDQDFIATGKVRYVMLDLPLRNHPFAFKAAEAATCAAGKGKFWEMHHLLFENQQALQPETLPTYAEQLGLDRGEFQACLEEGRKDSVNADLAQATKAGITATPTFLIGWLQDGDRLKPADVIRGAQPYENFERVLNQLLEKGPPSGDGE